MDETTFSLKRLEDEGAAQANYAAILERAPWLGNLLEAGRGIAEMNASRRVRLRRLIELADRIGEAIRPSAACQGTGCAQCCHQAVLISDLEAGLIEAVTGRTANRGFRDVTLGEQAQYQARYFRSPCPFLQAGGCSIYAVRPVACRLLFNIGASPFFCSIDIEPAQSRVAAVNLMEFWMVYAAVLDRCHHGDIRDFFSERPTV